MICQGVCTFARQVAAAGNPNRIFYVNQHRVDLRFRTELRCIAGAIRLPLFRILCWQPNTRTTNDDRKHSSERVTLQKSHHVGDSWLWKATSSVQEPTKSQRRCRVFADFFWS